MQMNLENNTASDIYATRCKEKKARILKVDSYFQMLTVQLNEQEMIRIVIPPTRVDIVRILSKISVDVVLEKNMMDQPLRKSTKRNGSET